MPVRGKQYGVVCFLVLLLTGLGARAQDARGSIIGQVTDSSGAAVPRALIRATRIETRQTSETHSDSAGYFTFSFQPAGLYVVEATAAGFKTLSEANVRVETEDARSLTLVLQLGNVAERVVVSGAAESLQTSTGSLSHSWDSTQLQSLPLGGQQAYNLLSLTPGVIFTQEQFGNSGFATLRGFDANGRFVINGGREGTNQFLLNGAPVSLTGAWQFTPTVGIIQEFKVLTNTYDAQFGRSGGGIVSTTLKSGTNQWHGEAFEYFHNSIFDANTIENNRQGAPRGIHTTNEFGGVLGGPLRKDHDFLFVSYEGFREVVPNPVVSDTPPLNLRDGQHFSAYGLKVYDPNSVHKCRPGIDTPAGSACFGPYIRQLFPGDRIPASRISAVGRNILALYPAPNGPGLTQNFLASSNTGSYRYDQPVVKWDHTFTERDRVSVAAAFDHGHEFQTTNGFPPPAETGNQINQGMDQNYIAEWTHILSPSTIWNLRLSFGRFTRFFPDSDDVGGVTAAALGITNLPQPANFAGDAPPSVNLELYSSIIGNTYKWNTENQWDLQPGFVQTVGRHVLHYGGEWAYAGVGAAGPGRANGEFSFNRSWTEQYTRGPRNAQDGSSVADLLLGLPGSGFVDYNDSSYRTWPYFALYAQDYWKVARSLTLTLGLRYDVQIPFVERFNRVNAGFDFTAKNPLSDEILARWRDLKLNYDQAHPNMPYPDPPAAIYGAKQFTSANARRPYDTDWTDLQPRIGVAWNFLPKTVLRAGAGIFYRTATQMNQSAGFNQRTNYIASLDGGVHPAAIGTGPYSLADPFPNGIRAPSGASLGALTDVGQVANFDGRQRPIPRTYQYSAGVQQQLPWDMIVEVAYSGSQTVHDSMTTQYDANSYQTLLLGQADPYSLSRRVPNPFSGILPSSSDLGSGATITIANLMRPYPIFNGIAEYTNPWARYRYDSLRVQAEKQFAESASGIFSFVLSYTFSKSFEANHRLNPWNLAEKPVHELSSLDKPQIFALSGVWDVPIGWGRRWWNQGNRFVGAITNGWAVDWIATYSSGYPVNQPDAVFTCGSYDAVGGQTEAQWFNNTKGCYSARPLYSLRTAPDRFSNIRNPAAPQLHASVEKTFWINDKVSTQFRGEAFNLTNTPIVGAPTTDFRDPRFGQLPLSQSNFPRFVQLAVKVVF